MTREQQVTLAVDVHDHQPLRGLERGLDRVGQAVLEVAPDHEAVDHDLDRVLLALVEVDLVG